MAQEMTWYSRDYRGDFYRDPDGQWAKREDVEPLLAAPDCEQAFWGCAIDKTQCPSRGDDKKCPRRGK